MKWRTMLVTASVLLNLGLLIYVAVPTEKVVTVVTEKVTVLPAAYGQNRAVAGGGYVATTAETSSSKDALFIVDNREKRLIVYGIGKGGLKAEAALDLRSPKAFGEALAGEVMVLPGAIASNTEAVYVIDPVGKKLIAVAYKSRKLELVGLADLAKDFTAP